jgi:hypothetical protein
MSKRPAFRLLTFRLSSLFVMTAVVALGSALYARAVTMERVCSELYKRRCPAIYSGSIPLSDCDDFCLLTCYSSSPPANEVQWRGFASAVIGHWETKRFTVFINPNRLQPCYKQEERILRLVLELPNLDTIVICAGQNPDMLEHPPVKAFVEQVRQHRPRIRIVVQQFMVVG